MSGNSMYSSITRQDFGRARMKETLGRILALLRPEKDEMLSLGDIRSLVRPDSETYKGMQTVPIDKIVGSEGRYRDFNKAFLPKHDKLMRRWMSVDEAHYRNVILPPIKLFEIGGAYFVRDGNHRVSVAKAQGTEFIDAEVISLSSEIPLAPDMTRDEIKRAVIEFEKSRFFQVTKLDQKQPDCSLEFTEVGRYDEILSHIRVHKWYINLDKSEEIPFEDAAVSWYDRVYAPVIAIIRETRLLARFPGATEADLYVYIGKHWGELNARYGPLFTLEEAAEDLSSDKSRSSRRGHSLVARIGAFLRGQR
ncbi:MAG TPA: transcriptional regulator [Spirochaetia bacterium]|nr:transcriptional regulator [Spirochaetia bacterium]